MRNQDEVPRVPHNLACVKFSVAMRKSAVFRATVSNMFLPYKLIVSTKSRLHQKSKTRVSVAPQKGLMSSKIFFKE